MSSEHLTGRDLPPEQMPPEELLQQMDERLPGVNGSPGLGTRIRETAMRKQREQHKKNSFAPPPYTVQVQVNRRNPLRVQAQNELFIQAYTMAAQAGQQFPLKMLFELLTVDGKDRIMPVLEEVDQQTQMLNQLMQENEQLKASNQNLKGLVDNYNTQMIKNAGTHGGGDMPELIDRDASSLVENPPDVKTAG